MNTKEEAAAVWLDVDQLKPWADNPRLNSSAVEAVADSITRFGFSSPIVARQEDHMIIAGHTRFQAALKLGYEQVPVRLLDLTADQARLLALADNKIGEIAQWDEAKLNEVIFSMNEDGLDLDNLGFSEEELQEILGDNGEWEKTGESGALTTKFGLPPLSVLDANKPNWMERKRYWKQFGFKSYLGREDIEDYTSCAGALIKKAGLWDKNKGGSVFDPVLCEIIYQWFNIEHGKILDPFAGGSVRGLVAAALGYQYIGHELRKQQVKANEDQAAISEKKWGWKPQPIWIEGDSNKTLESSSEKVDLVFSCPPYGSLEIYSDQVEDISNQPPDLFIQNYFSIIQKACNRLNEDRFAVFVVGEFRTKNGDYFNFVSQTIDAFIEAGLHFYNEIIGILPMVSVQFRCGRAFKASRKIGKTHQNILVFYKGNPKKASQFWKDQPIKIQSIELEEIENGN